MEKNCVNCGKPLPAEASFCPYCTTVQSEKTTPPPMRRWRKKALMGLAAALALCLCVGLGLNAYQASQQPKSYTAVGSLTYAIDGKRYDLLLGWAAPEEGQRIDHKIERELAVLPGDTWMSFTHLCVYPADGSAELATDFLDYVETVTLTAFPSDDNLPFETFPPERMDMWPFALYSANFAFSTECGENRLIWHLSMKNGDQLHISHNATVVEKTE